MLDDRRKLFPLTPGESFPQIDGGSERALLLACAHNRSLGIDGFNLRDASKGRHLHRLTNTAAITDLAGRCAQASTPVDPRSRNRIYSPPSQGSADRLRIAPPLASFCGLRSRIFTWAFAVGCFALPDGCLVFICFFCLGFAFSRILCRLELASTTVPGRRLNGRSNSRWSSAVARPVSWILRISFARFQFG